MSNYDPNNVFARILRGEIPCKKIYESKHSLAFHDVNPRAPVHALVIPKGAYVSSQDFYMTATAEEIQDFCQAVALVAQELGVDTTGYRTLTNHGRDAHQEVPHMHLHIMGKANLGDMLPFMQA